MLQISNSKEYGLKEINFLFFYIEEIISFIKNYKIKRYRLMPNNYSFYFPVFFATPVVAGVASKAKDKTADSTTKKETKRETKKGKEVLNKKGQEDESSQEPDNSTDLISPGGCMIILLAVLFDLANLICISISFVDAGLISQPVSFVISIMANIVFGIWIFFRIKGMKKYKKTTEVLKKAGKKAGKRYLFFGILDLIPYIGDIPSWTIFVYLTLRSKK